jgi:hypothetical protein
VDDSGARLELAHLVRAARGTALGNGTMSSPVARFTLLGALLFAGERTVLTLRTPLPRLEEQAAPTRSTRAEAREVAPNDMLLYREAIARRLFESDPVVHRRLVENLRFLGMGTGQSERALAQDAIALGLHRTDPVVRRRLVNVMRLRLEEPGLEAEPTDQELRAELTAHPERWNEPARVTVVHVFLSRARRGTALNHDEHRLLRALQMRGAPPVNAAELGDPFPEPLGQAPLSERELARILGPEPAAAALAAPVGGWSSPARSAFGSHLFFVRAKTPAHAPPLEAVRLAVRECVLAERAERAFARGLAELRAQALHDAGGGG